MHRILVSSLLVVFASHDVWSRSLERLTSSPPFVPGLDGSRKDPSTWQLASYSKESQLLSNEAEIELLAQTPSRPLLPGRFRRATRLAQEQTEARLQENYSIFPVKNREAESMSFSKEITETDIQARHALRKVEKDEENSLGFTELLMDLLVGYVEQQLSKRGTVAADLAPVSTTAQPATVDIKTLPGYWLRDPTMAEPESSLPVDYRTENYSLDDLLTTKVATSTAASPS